MKKLYKPWVAAILILFLLITPAAAKGPGDVILSLQIDNPIMKINGENAEIDTGRNTSPIIINNRTLVPIRSIIEAFGGNVYWDDETKTTTLFLNDTYVKLTINSTTAFLGNEAFALDTAPIIINGRTMLPIRFIAESFNLGVAWEQDIKTVSIIKNTFDDDEYNSLISVLPAYEGLPYVQINNNIPYFKPYEIIGGSFEYYADLDSLGRCDVTFASISTDIMPTAERGDISSVTPTGWLNKKYDVIPGKYLYNRCHLVGYQLTGENENPRNLITGTRELNISGMLPFENMVDNYIDETGNHVLYRVTPVFDDENLVARGVLMEAYSVEDEGRGICFCVFCYNVQPGIYINYLTGDSKLNENSSAFPDEEDITVYRTPTGKRYHTISQCGGKNSYEITLEKALEAGLSPCSKCG